MKKIIGISIGIIFIFGICAYPVLVKAEEDTTPPVISELSVTEIITNSALITWVTDEEADSKVWYGSSSPVDTSLDPAVSDSELTLDHSLSLSDLLASTTYYYVVSSTDPSDNTATSDEATFETLAEDTDLTELQALIEQLRQQIEVLEAKIEALLEAKEIKEAGKEVKTTLRLIRQLQWGMTGEDVETLQEILKTDPEIYPEGLVTGYFGPLTFNAVKKFQKIAGIEQVGRVGPKTLSKINHLLEFGAGKSGKVPPGLLIAPGIRKKLGDYEPEFSCDDLPPGISKKLCEEGEEEEEEDTTPPVISELSATGITADSALIIWVTDEEADSKVWYGSSSPVDTSLDPATSDSELTLNHSLEISDLVLSTTYYYVVSSADTEDNVTVSDEASFETLAEEEEDTTPPVISQLSAIETTTNSTMITWVTDEEADSKAWNSTSTPVDTDSTPTASDSNLTLDHNLAIFDLTPDTTYYYVVSSADAVDNTTTSSEASFETSAE